MKLFEPEMEKTNNNDAETLRLLREYTSLKNLIDSHKLQTTARHPAAPSAPRQYAPARHTAINPYPPPPRPPGQMSATRFQSRQFSCGNSRFTLDRTKSLQTAPTLKTTPVTITQPKPTAMQAPSTSKTFHGPPTVTTTTTTAFSSITAFRRPIKTPVTTNATNQKSSTSQPPLPPPIGSVPSAAVAKRAPGVAPVSRGATSSVNQLPSSERRLSMPRPQPRSVPLPTSNQSTATVAKRVPGIATTFTLVRNVAVSVKKPPLPPSLPKLSCPPPATKKVVLGKLKTKIINLHAVADKPVKSGSPVVPLSKSRFKFRRLTTASPKGASPARKRIATTYKIVKVPKKRTPKPAPSSSSVNSKYSWRPALAGHPAKPRTPLTSGRKEVRRRVLLKSKYKLKMSNVMSPGHGVLAGRRVTRQRIRRVEQFSLNYVTPPTNTGVQSRRGNLVSIGGIIYKSSQTKLTKKSEAMRRTATPSRSFSRAVSAKKEQQPVTNRLVTVRGIKFVMDSNRKVLQRIATTSGTDPAERITSTSKARFQNLTRIDIGGETYLQRTPGVLVKSASNQTRTLANRFKNRSLTFLKSSLQKAKQYCLFYNKFGKCSKLSNGGCPYIHDSDKIKVCKRFLREGKCEVAACPFTHKLCPLKMPVCTFFLLGRCAHDVCTYRHVNVNPEAGVCLDYTRGHCPLGERILLRHKPIHDSARHLCKKWHADVCPQFAARGRCDRGDKCPLPHRRKTAKTKRTMEETESASVTTARALKRPEPDAVSEASDSEDSPTKRPRLPSFISLADTTADVSAEPLPATKNTAKGLQIRPHFLKLDKENN